MLMLNLKDFDLIYKYRSFYVKRYGNSEQLNRAIKNICSSFDNIYLLEEVLNFFSSTPDGDGYIQRIQTLDIIFNNIFWVTSRENEITEAFFIPTRS